MYRGMFILMLLLGSCKDLFRYSPNEVRVEEHMRDLNRKNISRINALPQGNSLTFAVIGDAQRFYDELDDFVTHINSRNDVSFVVLNGDITDFGLNREYEWVYRSLSRLHMPFITVIGNHDMLSNGRKVYAEMFGAENFSFVVGGSRFIFFNSSSRETGFDGTLPDIAWLQDAIGQRRASEKLFLFSHVPPFHGDFDPALAGPYASLLADNQVAMSIHGHAHNFSSGQHYNDGVQYLVTTSMGKRGYAVVKIQPDAYDLEEVYF